MKRAEAHLLGLFTFVPDKPCGRGHSERYTSCRACVGCERLRYPTRAKRLSAEDKTPEARRARFRANWHRYKNRGKRHREAQEQKAQRAIEREQRRAARLAAVEDYRAEREARGERRKDPAVRREYGRAWRAANAERMRELKRKWKAEHPEANRGRDRKSTARKRERLLKLQRGRCAICRVKLGDEVHVDHIVPRARGGSNRMSNLQATHPACNLAKSDRDPIDFMQSLGRLI